MINNANAHYILDLVSLFSPSCHPFIPAHTPSHSDVRRQRHMFRSKFSTSVESFLSSVSSSAPTDCGCVGCEQTYPTSRRPFFRRSFPSLSKLYIPAKPLVRTAYLFGGVADLHLRQHCTLPLPSPSPSSNTLQQQQEQLISMGYSKVFTLGYLSATVSPPHHILHLRSVNTIRTSGCLSTFGLGPETHIYSSHPSSFSEHPKILPPYNL